MSSLKSSNMPKVVCHFSYRLANLANDSNIRNISLLIESKYLLIPTKNTIYLGFFQTIIDHVLNDCLPPIQPLQSIHNIETACEIIFQLKDSFDYSLEDFIVVLSQFNQNQKPSQTCKKFINYIIIRYANEKQSTLKITQTLSKNVICHKKVTKMLIENFQSRPSFYIKLLHNYQYDPNMFYFFPFPSTKFTLRNHSWSLDRRLDLFANGKHVSVVIAGESLYRQTGSVDYIICNVDHDCEKDIIHKLKLTSFHPTDEKSLYWPHQTTIIKNDCRYIFTDLNLNQSISKYPEWAQFYRDQKGFVKWRTCVGMCQIFGISLPFGTPIEQIYQLKQIGFDVIVEDRVVCNDSLWKTFIERIKQIV